MTDPTPTDIDKIFRTNPRDCIKTHLRYAMKTCHELHKLYPELRSLGEACSQNILYLLNEMERIDNDK